METRLQAHLNAVRPPSFTPARSGMLQCKCECSTSDEAETTAARIAYRWFNGLPLDPMTSSHWKLKHTILRPGLGLGILQQTVQIRTQLLFKLDHRKAHEEANQ